jgi:hypothetical protein
VFRGGWFNEVLIVGEDMRIKQEGGAKGFLLEERGNVKSIPMGSSLLINLHWRETGVRLLFINLKNLLIRNCGVSFLFIQITFEVTKQINSLLFQ